MGTQFDAEGHGQRPGQVLPGVVGASACLRAAALQVPMMAQCDATCLLLGETGTGKELFARAIHYMSARARKPFVPVNCGAIPDSLFENELFGHVQGAYTDARGPNAGLLAYAEAGTLFLDEIDSLSPAAQVKLLRVLQEKEYRPIGSPREVHTDIRLIAATNSDLSERIRARHFREDLYHRLNVLRLTIPPLRQRREDISLLAVHFAKEYAHSHARPIQGIEPVAVERLAAYSWPGNVRELQGVLQRAVLLAQGPIITSADLDLPQAASESPHPNTLTASKKQAIQEFERSYLSDLLQRCEGNVTRAAQAAGKERRSFQRLLQKHQLAPTSFRNR